MEIVLATHEDASGILALWPQIYNVSSLPADAEPMLLSLIDSETCDVAVACEAGKVVGCGMQFYLPIPAHGKNAAYLEGIAVDKKMRGKGIGTALIKKFIELARARNCYKIIFTSGNRRREIHKFYENLGFVKWGVEFRMDLGSY